MSGVEKRVFMVLVLIFGAAFFVLSLMISLDYTQKTDLLVTEWFYNVRGEYQGTIYFIFRFLTELGFVYIIVPLILVVSIKWKFDNRSFCFGFGCLFVFIFNHLVKILYNRERPLLEMQWMSENTTSFPSGHAMTSFFIYGYLVYFLLHSDYHKRIKALGVSLCIGIVIAVGITRIGLGVHYLTDIIGGYFLGFVGLTVVLFFYDYLYSIGFEFIYGKFKKNKGNIHKR